MKVCFIISGIPRGFLKYLHPFLIELHTLQPFDVYCNFAKNSSDSLYENETTDFSNLNHFYKTIIESENKYSLPSKKDSNILNQWYRIQKTFELIHTDYDIYIRIRPDIQILFSPQNFLELLLLHYEQKSSISIPNGYDFFNGVHLHKESALNDQIAICSKESILYYCSFIDYILLQPTPYYSEKFLLNYLKSYTIERVILPYKLILSECRVLSIAGDSGSGKTTLANALQTILFDSSITFETDRYHKWERSSTQWNTYTHLHPDANNLEKMSEDVFRLKLGESIYAVDYDHSTGTFTPPQQIQPKPILLVCGLHTLHSLRNISDIKIYLDTELSLKNEWKLSRDSHRGYTKQTILNTIEKRKNDYISHILPQKLHSNIIIEYSSDIKLHIDTSFNYYVNSFLSQISTISSTYSNFHTYTLQKEKITPTLFSIYDINTDRLKEYPFNILQSIIYLILFNG